MGSKDDMVNGRFNLGWALDEVLRRIDLLKVPEISRLAPVRSELSDKTECLDMNCPKCGEKQSARMFVIGPRIPHAGWINCSSCKGSFTLLQLVNGDLEGTQRGQAWYRAYAYLRDIAGLDFGEEAPNG